MTKKFLAALAFLTALLVHACGPASTPPDTAPGSHAGPRTGFGGPMAPQGGTITSVLPTTGGGLTGGGSAGAVTLGLITTCSSTQVLVWSGTAWACGTGGITNSAGNNVVPKSNGPNLVASSLSDDGTTVQTAELFQTGGNITVAKGAAQAPQYVLTQTLQKSWSMYEATSSDTFAIWNSTFGDVLDILGTGQATFNSTLTASGFTSGGFIVLNPDTSSWLQLGEVNNSTYKNALIESATTGAGMALRTAGVDRITIANGGTTTITGASNANSVTVTHSQTAQTANNHTVDATMSGTYDTTAGTLFPVAVNATSIATRSAGANNLDNIALFADATNGQVNYAIYADRGDVILNNTSGTTTIHGNTTIGAATTGNHVINGRVTGGTSTFADGLSWTNTASSAAYAMDAITATATGSFDTTATGRNAFGGQFVANGTQGAGTNGVTNYGVRASATGAGAGVTNVGVFGSASGGSVENTAFMATATAAGTNLFKFTGTDVLANTDNNNGPIIRLGINTAGRRDLQIVDSAQQALSGSNMAIDFGVSSSIGNYIASVSTNWGANEPLQITGSTLTLNGILAVTSVSTFSREITLNETLSAQAVDVKADAIVDTASFDTTAAARASYGLYVSAANTISTGANTLTTIAADFTNTSSGANVNAWALTTESGDVKFNTVSGTTTIQGSTTVNNSLFVAGASGVGTTATVNFSQAAQTVAGSAEIASNTGSFNTTAGALTSYALQAANTSTRSAGANNLTAIGLYVKATSGQVNYGIQSDADVFLNSSAHILLKDTAQPTGSGCTLSANSSDTAGALTMSTGGTTLCTVTFNRPFPTTPICVCSVGANTATGQAFDDCEGASTTTMTIHVTSSTAAGTFNFICVAHN